MVLYLTFTSCWICSRAHHARCVGLDRSDARFICSACQRRTQERTIAGGRKEVGGSKYFYHSANLFLCRSRGPWPRPATPSPAPPSRPATAAAGGA